MTQPLGAILGVIILLLPALVAIAVYEVRQYRTNRAFLAACRAHDNYRRDSQ